MRCSAGAGVLRLPVARRHYRDRHGPVTVGGPVPGVKASRLSASPATSRLRVSHGVQVCLIPGPISESTSLSTVTGRRTVTGKLAMIIITVVQLEACHCHSEFKLPQCQCDRRPSRTGSESVEAPKLPGLKLPSTFKVEPEAEGMMLLRILLVAPRLPSPERRSDYDRARAHRDRDHWHSV
jgi:hypothetical protein